MSDPGQEREALTEIERMATGCGGLSWSKALERLTAVRDVARAALPAREEPQSIVTNRPEDGPTAMGGREEPLDPPYREIIAGLRTQLSEARTRESRALEREALLAAREEPTTGQIEKTAALIYGEVGPVKVCNWESVDQPSKTMWRLVAQRVLRGPAREDTERPDEMPQTAREMMDRIK